MTFLILAMGVLLMLVGAISTVSGAPIIQIERGWAEVIAGSVAVSGGAVTFAIGVVLLRLQLWQQAIAVKAVAVAPEAQPALIDAMRPTRAPEDRLEIAGEPVTVDPDETFAKEGRDHPVQWMPVADSETISPASSLVDAAEPVVAAVPTIGSAEPRNEEAALPDADTSIIPDRTVAGEPEGATGRPRLSFAPADRSGDDGAWRSTFSRDWMSRPLLRSRAPKPTPAEPPPLFADETAEDGGQAPLVDLAKRSEPAASAGLAPAIGAADLDEPALKPEIAVVGRYQSGASTYTMFSNGAIDVETEAGDIHSFASMAELKAFIARQETAVS